MTRTAEVIDAIAVYSGTRYLGEVRSLRNGQIEALDASGSRVGFFPDRRAAEHGLWLVTRSRVAA